METIDNIDLLTDTSSSIYPLLALVVFFVLLLCVILYIAFRFIKTTQPDPQKEAYKTLKKIDLSDSKKAAYRLTKYAAFFNNNPYKEDMLSSIEQYKYSKEIVDFDDASLKLIKRFIANCKI